MRDLPNKLREYAENKMNKDTRDIEKTMMNNLFIEYYSGRMLGILTVYEDDSGDSIDNYSLFNDFMDMFHEKNEIVMTLIILEFYVAHETIPDLDEDYIQTYLVKNAEPANITVYRGQGNSTITNHRWFSCSLDKKIAQRFQERAEDDTGEGFLFEIQLVNVHVININELIQKNAPEWLSNIGRFDSEQEIIVSGGGTFYSDENMTSQGFHQTKNNYMQCWYSNANIRNRGGRHKKTIKHRKRNQIKKNTMRKN